ncbi:MAG TPA: hypothetical protein VLI05_06890 [Candidatus Saccharimonadia bacterium]|nr:hypothetical protein [Candidatus Saccharimonadia bacterium]
MTTPPLAGPMPEGLIGPQVFPARDCPVSADLRSLAHRLIWRDDLEGRGAGFADWLLRRLREQEGGVFLYKEGSWAPTRRNANSPIVENMIRAVCRLPWTEPVSLSTTPVLTPA